MHTSLRVVAHPAGRQLGLLVAGALLAVVPAAAQTELVITARTDKARYNLGERVRAEVEACNLTGHPVQDLYHPGDCGSDQLQVFGASGGDPVAFSGYQPWCTPWMVPIELAPGECAVIYEWLWPQVAGGYPEPGDGTQVTPGFYTVQGNAFNITTEPYRFEITAQAPTVPVLGPAALAALIVAIAATGGLILLRRL